MKMVTVEWNRGDVRRFPDAYIGSVEEGVVTVKSRTCLVAVVSMEEARCVREDVVADEEIDGGKTEKRVQGVARCSVCGERMKWGEGSELGPGWFHEGGLKDHAATMGPVDDGFKVPYTSGAWGETDEEVKEAEEFAERCQRGFGAPTTDVRYWYVLMARYAKWREERSVAERVPGKSGSAI